MNGSQLARMAATADLARREMGVTPLTLEAKDGVIAAIFRGAYCVGRAVEPWTGPDMICTIDGPQFKAIVSLFGDDEVRIDPPKDGAVQLSSSGGGGKAASLKIEHSAEPWEFDNPPLVPANGDFWITVDRDSLLAEMQTVGLFVGDKNAMAILEGARIDLYRNGDGTAVKVSAANGKTCVYVKDNAIEVLDEDDAHVNGYVIAVPQDLEVGLKILNPGIVYMLYSAASGRLLLHDGPNLFYTSSMQGEWPNFDQIIAGIGPVESIDIPSEAIRTVGTASAALKSGSDIELATGARGGIVIRTVKSDAGAFALRQGSGNLPRNILYNGELLVQATKLADELQFLIPENVKKPTTIIAGDRRLYLVPKLYSGPTV